MAASPFGTCPAATRLMIGVLALLTAVGWSPSLTKSQQTDDPAQRPVTDQGVFQEAVDFTTYGGDWTFSPSEIRGVAAGEGRVIVKQPVGDAQLSTTIQLSEPDTQAGLVFRSRQHRLGVDGYQGYYIGLDLPRNSLVWGSVDGQWKTIASKIVPLSMNVPYRLTVRFAGERVSIALREPDSDSDDRTLDAPLTGTWLIDGRDADFSTGDFGMRVLGGAAEFGPLTLTSVDPQPPGKTYTNPLQVGCADPAILQYQGKYYLYCTDSRQAPDMPTGIKLFVSDDLVHWTDGGYALKRDDSWGEKQFWAPDIIHRDGTFYLYYAAETRICVATSDSPMGPFRQTQQQPMSPESIRIDAHVFRDDDGQYYFYYVHFHEGNEIWGGKLNDDMVSVDAASLRRMIIPDQPWERHQAPIAEGPEVIKHKGVYYLTYSGSHFENPNYAVGYATSDSPLGPWKKSRWNPVMKSTSYAHGTAHHCLTTSPDGSERFIVYHRHFDLQNTEPRQLAIDRFQFVPQDDGPDRLEVYGPTVTPQPLPSDHE